MNDEHVIEDLTAYALGSLEGPDRERVEAHLASCTTCTQAGEQYRGVVSVLPLGLAPVTPPPAAWSSILAAVRAGRGPARQPRAAVHWLRLARWPAVATVVAGLLVWNVMLLQELARRAPGPAPGPEVEALSRRPGRVVILKGTGVPGASARLFVASDGGHGHLAISGLKRLPPERVYQVWFTRPGAPTVSGATFGVDAYQRAWVKVAVPPAFGEVQTIIVTDEPAPGSALPTGDALLEARPGP